MKTTRTLMMALVCACCMLAMSATTLAQDGSPTSCPDPNSTPLLADFEILGGTGVVGTSYPYAGYLFTVETTPLELVGLNPGGNNGLYYPNERLVIDTPRFGSILLNTGKVWMKFAHGNVPDMVVALYDSTNNVIYSAFLDGSAISTNPYYMAYTGSTPIDRIAIVSNGNETVINQICVY